MAGTNYDVIVIGAGNAGLTAALAARKQEMRVLLLDKCPKATRGGNTRFSGGGFRFTYKNLDDMRPMLPDLTDEEAAKMEVGTYSNAEFFEDVMQVTEYAADKKLTNILVDQSYATARWLTDMKVKWILSTSTHAVKVGGKIKFPSGRVISVNDGGLGLVEMLFPTAAKNGIEIIYEAKAKGLTVDAKGKVSGVRVQTAEGLVDFPSRAVVLAAGGFEANPEMRALSRHGLGLGESSRVALQHRRGAQFGAGVWRAADRPLERLPRGAGRCGSARRRVRLRAPLFVPLRHHGRHQRQALRRRGRGLFQLYLREMRPGSVALAVAHRLSDFLQQNPSAAALAIFVPCRSREVECSFRDPPDRPRRAPRTPCTGRRRHGHELHTARCYLEPAAPRM